MMMMHGGVPRYSILVETLQKTFCHGFEYVVAGFMALQVIEGCRSFELELSTAMKHVS
jgi:hypothetical protein